MTDPSIDCWEENKKPNTSSACRSNRWVPDEISMRPWLTTLTRSAIATMSSSATIPTDMKCVFYGDLNKVQTIPVPKHKPGHLLVQVKAVGLNPVDAKDVFGDKLPHSWSTGHAVVRWYIKDKIPGFDFAGVVVASSSSGATDEYQPGDKVYGTMPPFTGSLAEYVDAPLDQVCHMPENFSFEEAAATPLVCLTAYQCLSPHVTAESKVLVVGASGGTGHVMTQVAKCLGSSCIVAVCSKSNFDFCQSNGATHLVDYSDRDAMMRELHQHGPFDIVVDCVSSADPRDSSAGYPALLQTEEGLLSENYVYRRLGGPSFDWIRAGLQRTLGLQWWSNPHDQLFWIRFPKSHGELDKLKQWAEEGKLKPYVGKILGLSQVPEAFAMILSRRLQGKVVVQISAETS